MVDRKKTVLGRKHAALENMYRRFLVGLSPTCPNTRAATVLESIEKEIFISNSFKACQLSNAKNSNPLLMSSDYEWHTNALLLISW